jgi:phosphoribosylformylglycinamidine cyclo-ligase
MIQESAGTDWKEMYQVFNMGQRLEIFTNSQAAEKLIEIASEFGIEAQISGYIEASDKNELIIDSEFGSFAY